MNKVTALYCRVACKETANGESVSIQRQKAKLYRFAVENGIKHSRCYSDNGYSGLNFNRKGFNKMLAAAKNGELDKIIVTDISRFGRNMLEVVRYTKDILPKLGVEIICLTNT